MKSARDVIAEALSCQLGATVSEADAEADTILAALNAAGYVVTPREPPGCPTPGACSCHGTAPRDEFETRRAAGEHCHGGRDGDCFDARCPQLRDGEPVRTGRHCPLDAAEDWEAA